MKLYKWFCNKCEEEKLMRIILSGRNKGVKLMCNDCGSKTTFLNFKRVENKEYKGEGYENDL